MTVPDYFVETFKPDHIMSLEHRPAIIKYPLPATISTIQCSDFAVVSSGLEGTVEWINHKRTHIWIDQNLEGMPIELVQWRPPSTLSFTKERGYDIMIGDIVTVVRGRWHRNIGEVHAVSFADASIILWLSSIGIEVSFPFFYCVPYHLSHYVQVEVPITFCSKLSEYSQCEVTKYVGHDVWVISGDKKGRHATLRSIGREKSWIALEGHQLFEVKNTQVATT